MLVWFAGEENAGYFKVGRVTEFLRLFSVALSSSSIPSNKDRSKYKNICRDVDDVMEFLRSDYGNVYFVTGIFTCAIYSDDCNFEDPTISYKGTELYERNLRLMAPFLEDASIELQKCKVWRRTYLKLPWRPLISINGSTVYDLDRDLKDCEACRELECLCA